MLLLVGHVNICWLAVCIIDCWPRVIVVNLSCDILFDLPYVLVVCSCKIVVGWPCVSLLVGL